MTEDLQELLFALCAAPGTPGDESEAARRAAWELSDCGETEIDRMGNVICRMGNQTAQQQILLDAHLDQVGLIVTRIETNGFCASTAAAARTAGSSRAARSPCLARNR